MGQQLVIVEDTESEVLSSSLSSEAEVESAVASASSLKTRLPKRIPRTDSIVPPVLIAESTVQLNDSSTFMACEPQVTAVANDPVLYSNPAVLFANPSVVNNVQSNSLQLPSCFSSETFAMMFGLLYDNLIQKIKIEELQKREEERRQADGRAAFAAQLQMMMHFNI